MPGNIGRYEIDYIMIKRGYRQQIHMCKAFPGADYNTGHNLLLSSHNFTTTTVWKKPKP